MIPYRDMKVLYLFNRVRMGLVDKVKSGESHDNHFYGMLRLPKYGVQAEYIEIEQYFPLALCRFLRNHILNIYYVHIPLFFKLLAYDFVFTSTAFGSQLIHTLYPFKKPKWVMFDFSITGLLGKETTRRQKIFRYLVTHAAGIVTISKNEEERLHLRFPEMKDRIKFIPLGTDTDFFKPKDVLEEHTIFTVGFDPGRDYTTFIEATKDSSAQVVIATRPSKVEGYELPKNFTAKEFTPQGIVEGYSKSKVFVLPLNIKGGINDAMGCSTLVEAMAMAKAIVATRTPTMESYITSGVNGVLVPAEDPHAMKEAIESLLNDDEKRKLMGKAARQFVIEHCTADGVAKNLADFFKKLSLMK